MHREMHAVSLPCLHKEFSATFTIFCNKSFFSKNRLINPRLVERVSPGASRRDEFLDRGCDLLPERQFLGRSSPGSRCSLGRSRRAGVDWVGADEVLAEKRRSLSKRHNLLAEFLAAHKLNFRQVQLAHLHGRRPGRRSRRRRDDAFLHLQRLHSQ